MKRLLILCVVFCLAATAFAAEGKDNKAEDRLKAAASVLDEIQAAPDQGMPEEVLGSAQCVAVVPTMLKGGFIVGARFGRGVASCRTPKGWTAPAFFTIKGGAFGWRIGARGFDLGLWFLKKEGWRTFRTAQSKLGSSP